MARTGNAHETDQSKWTDAQAPHVPSHRLGAHLGHYFAFALGTVVLVVAASVVAGCGREKVAPHAKLPPSFLVSEYVKPSKRFWMDDPWNSGHFSVGGFLLGKGDWSLGGASRFFGEPTTKKLVGEGFFVQCVLTWPRIGLEIRRSYEFWEHETCGSDKGVEWVALRDRRWHTERGLHVRDPMARVHRLYPEARHARGVWYLESGPTLRPEGKDTGDGPEIVKTTGVWMAVSVAGGRVTSIVVASFDAEADYYPFSPRS